VTSDECGGVKVDCAGMVWDADTGYSQPDESWTCDLGGGAEGCVIGGLQALFGCEDEATEDIFQCEHWDSSSAPELDYAFAVPNGPYLVNLFFANIYTGTSAPGERLFDIFIEGALAYDDFDQVAAAGGSGQAVVRSFVTSVSDGSLDILFGHVLENPAIKAIEVLRQDRDGDGVFPPADCGDLDPAVHAGATEVCDGVDNDCDALTDEVPPPAGAPTLGVEAVAGAAAVVSWSALAGASGYDLIAGDLATLRASGGDFAAAIDACLLNDDAATSYQDAMIPPVGGGRFYLVRGSNCGGGGSWESGDPGQAAPRGPGITLSAAACP
jgi:hypothetical protein